MVQVNDMMKSLAVLTGLVCCLVLVGCGGGSAGSKTNAFDTAPADVKAEWQSAVAAMATNGYIAAITALDSLQARQGLSADQLAAADKFRGDVMDQVFEKAGNGDAKAAEALKQIRDAVRR